MCLRLCWFRPKRISPDRESMQCRRNIERATRGKGGPLALQPLAPVPTDSGGEGGQGREEPTRQDREGTAKSLFPRRKY